MFKKDPLRRGPSSRAMDWVPLATVGLVVAGFGMVRPLHDFVEYWTSAHQIVAGQNPYSLAQMSELERALGWRGSVPLMNLIPPWGLPLIAPIALVKWYALAWVLWVGGLILIVWWSTRRLLDFYAGPARVFPNESYASEPILGFTFFPVLGCLAVAQITPLILLGITGFLWFERKERYMLAGMCLGLATIKPHLVYLVLTAVFLTTWRGKRPLILLGTASAIAVFAGIAMVMRSTIVADYWVLSHSGYMRVFPSALGAILRYPFRSRDVFVLQFVPPLIGMIWFLLYWYKRRHAWDWKEQMPVLITASVLTAAYGWTFDQVLLVVPIVALAAKYAPAHGKLPRRMVVIYSALNVALVIALLAWRIAIILAPLTFAVVLFLEARRRSVFAEAIQIPALSSRST